MANATYYLGANTPEGFASHYTALFHDRRIRNLVIIKGGPGCGKSTLMRHVAAAAKERGCDTEQILCSSDPDSLDGVIIPKAGLALVDGTAPHVVEPPLCGLGAWYLDLGKFYNGSVLEQNSTALLDAKEKNAACYPLCYLALRSAKAASDGLHKIAKTALPPDTLTETKARLLPRLLPQNADGGDVLHRFVSAITPKGLLCTALPCATVYPIRDSYGLSAPLLEGICADYAAAGHTVIRAYDPLSPNQLQAVQVPALDTAYVISSRLFPLAGQNAPWLDLDALVAQRLTYEQEQRLHALEQLRSSAVHEAVRYLTTAKRHHDALEDAYRPSVDFVGVAEIAESVVQTLHHLLS